MTKEEVVNLTKQVSTLNSLLTSTLVRMKKGEEIFIEDIDVLTDEVEKLDEEISYTKYLMFRYNEIEGEDITIKKQQLND